MFIAPTIPYQLLEVYNQNEGPGLHVLDLLVTHDVLSLVPRLSRCLGMRLSTLCALQGNQYSYVSV